MRKEKHQIDKNTKMVLDEFYTDLRLENRSEVTIQGYKWKLEYFFGTIAFTLNQLQICNVFDWLKNNVWGLKATSIDSYVSVLSKFFNYCLDNEYIDKILIKHRWRPKIPKPLPKYLDSNETAKVKIQAEKSSILERILLLFLLATGCRCSEATGLNRDKLNIEDRTAWVFGKGGKWRHVDFSIECSIVLQDYLRQRNDDNPALFVKKNGERLKNKDAYRIIVKLGQLSNLPSRFTPHCCRHTFATFMLSKGASLLLIAQCLGHEDLNKTNIYARVPTADLISCYNKKMGWI